MRKALIVGIDYYQYDKPLSGCVNDALAVREVLERHADESPNFRQPRVILGTGPTDIVTRVQLRSAVEELFKGDPEIALFYFAGHGWLETSGGYLCSGDCAPGDVGLSLQEVMTYANKSHAKNKVIVLDSCQSGVAGSHPISSNVAELAEGVTILTASTSNQYAMEIPGGGAGVFTSLFVDALRGAAANLVGQVSPGSVYAHIDQSLGEWSQRPVFKTNVKTFVSLRNVPPPIPTAELRRIAEFFPSPHFDYKLDPSYEPERNAEQLADKSFPAPDPKRTAIFKILQNYARVNLVVPVGAPHMWHAAISYKSCRLTPTGEHYRKLVFEGLI